MPKILWMSPYSLHDISSGASIHCKTVLQGLVKRGFQVWSCSSFIFDVPNGASSFENLKEKLDSSTQSVFELDDQGIHYVYTRCKSTFENDQTLSESELYFNVYCEVLDRFKPDFVMAFGTSMVSMTCFAEAKRRGIYTIYPVLNGNHGHYAFPDIDIILTDSKASERMYRNRDRIRMTPTCEIFAPEMYLASDREPKYVTFVNPSFEKGLSIFAKLAYLARKELPDVKFLVVNSRGNFAENVQYLHEKDDKNNHPFTPKDFPNVDMTPGTSDMRPIYRLTKAMIMPSLWWESWGRVATESVINSIPVLASSSGGLPEAIAGAGFTLDLPKHCTEDYFSIPSDEEIAPWMEHLKRLLTEDFSERFKIAHEELSVDKGIDRFAHILKVYSDTNPSHRIRYGFSTGDL